MKRVLLLAFSIAWAGSIAVDAEAQHFDVFVAEDAGKVAIGGYSFDDDVIANSQIFEAELEADAGQYAGIEPGFVSGDPDPASMPSGWTPLASSPSILLGFDVNTTLGRNLLFWDAVGGTVGDVEFGAVADGEILAITQTGCFVCDSITVDGGTSPVLGFVLDDTANPVHDHPEFQLFGDASVTPDTVTPGIYLLNLKVTVTDLADADPTWILFAAFDPADYPELDEEQFDAFIEGQNALAAEWVAANVPEPGTVLLLGGGVAALAARHRRRE